MDEQCYQHNFRRNLKNISKYSRKTGKIGSNKSYFQKFVSRSIVISVHEMHGLQQNARNDRNARFARIAHF
nr:MAG TPA: hypothetical protein [Caudoviricetes sp.]